MASGTAHFRTRRGSSQPLRDSAAPGPGPAPFRRPPRLGGAAPREPPPAPRREGRLPGDRGTRGARVSAPSQPAARFPRPPQLPLRPPAERARMAEVRSQRPLLCRLSFDPSPSSLSCYPVSHPPTPNSPSVSILSPPTSALYRPAPVPVGAGSFTSCPSFHRGTPSPTPSHPVNWRGAKRGRAFLSSALTHDRPPPLDSESKGETTGEIHTEILMSC